MSTTNVVRVRPAVMFDLLTLVELAQMYVDEAVAWSSMPFDAGRAAFYGGLAITADDQELLVATLDDKVVGFMWLALRPQVWTEAILAEDLFLYVRPEARGLKIGELLTAEAERWAKRSGAVGMMTGAHSGVEHNVPAEQLYASKGYVNFGSNFFKPFK